MKSFKNVVSIVTLASLGLAAVPSVSASLNSNQYTLAAATYTQSMNAGYTAVKKKNYRVALTNFKQALSLRPSDRYATQAIQNVNQLLGVKPVSNSRSRQPVNLVLARKMVAQYLDEITNKGSDGTYYFCSQHKEFQSTFFSPSKARILKVIEGNNGSAIARIQLDSSNQGGVPIRRNWSIYMDKEKNPVRAKSFPGGWCILSVGTFG